MLGVHLYAYCVGERSSRRIEQCLCDDVAFRVFAGILELAVSARELGSNPCRDRLVRNARPKIPRKTLRREDVPTEDEVAAIIDSVHERWRGLLMVYGGLRFGEAAGLAPEDVVVGGVYVRRAASETSRGLLLGQVKDHE